MKIRNQALAIGLVTVGVSALAIPFALPSAQGQGTATPTAQHPVQTPRPGGMPVNLPPQAGGQMPPQFGPMPQGPPMMMGGTAMALDGGYLYVVQGGEIFKVRKSDLLVEAHGHLFEHMHEGLPTLPPPTRRAGGGGKQ